MSREQTAKPTVWHRLGVQAYYSRNYRYNWPTVNSYQNQCYNYDSCYDYADDYSLSEHVSGGVLQQQQIQVVGNGGQQYCGVSTQSYAFTNGGGYNQTYQQSYMQNHDNYSRAKSTRWDRSPNQNQIALKNIPSHYGPGKKCFDCGQFFTDNKTLYAHKDQVHNGWRRGSGSSHLTKRFFGRTFYCSICNKEFPSHALMKKHELTHTMNACQKCPETFKFKESLWAHVKHAHPSRLPAITENGEVESEPANDKPDGSAGVSGVSDAQPCLPPEVTENSGTEADQANDYKPDSSAPEADQDMVAGVRKNDKCSFSEPAAASTPIVKKNPTEISGNSEVKIEQLQCPFCIKSFDSEKLLASHYKIHTEADPREINADADQCKVDTDAGGSSRAEGEPEIASLSCPLCIKKFTSRRGLFVHLNSAHTQIFYCTKCPKEFAAQSQLEEHKKEHQ